MSEVAKGKLHSILRLEVSQLLKPRVSDFGTNWGWWADLWGAVFLFILYLWISKIHFRISIIHFWISKNKFRISQNNYGYPKLFLDIQKCILGYHKSILDIHNSFLDIQKSIYGDPKIHFWISKKQTEFWIAIIRFLDIHNSFLDIQKSVYFRIS